MQLVGRFVKPAAPSSSLEGTKTQGTSLSSQRTGTCDSTSIGDTSPAMMHVPFEPLRTALTTSLTPLLRAFSLAAFFTALRIFFASFSSAIGLAMGEMSLTVPIFVPWSLDALLSLVVLRSLQRQDTRLSPLESAPM